MKTSMNIFRSILSGMALVATLGSSLHAETRALRLVAQQSWSARQGFFLALEGTGDREPVTLDNVSLQLAVGDGKNWNYLAAKPKWQLGKQYQIKAVIGEKESFLFLDGALVTKKKVRFAPQAGALTINEIPSWQRAHADYMVLPHRVRITDTSGQKIERDFTALVDRPMAIQLLSSTVRQKLDWQSIAAQTITIETEFEFRAMPDPRELAPFVDRYGQPTAVDYPGKIKSDADLTAAWELEKKKLTQWKPAENVDRFGGSTALGWSEKNTGFYRLKERDGYWWLITPEGNPCYFIGICGVPGLNWPPTPVSGREYLFAELPPRFGAYREVWEKNLWGSDDGSEYVCFSAANMIRKYGEDWKNISRDLTAQRIKAWGFSGAGKWGGLFGDGAKLGQQEGVGCIGYLRLDGVARIAGRPDVFDPAVQSAIEESLARQIRPHVKNPWVLGWGVGNEYKEVIKPEDIRGLLKENSPAKRALIDRALSELYRNDFNALAQSWKTTATTCDALAESELTPTDADVEHLRRFFADRYYALLYKTVKKIDPNHLYFGFWITPGWWVNEHDWRLIAPHCDAIGYDRYDPGFAEPKFLELINETKKPVLCGEFGFPTTYGGQRGYGAYRSEAETESACGELYRAALKEAAENKFSVGMIWFDYRDQIILGRGEKNASQKPRLVIGENYAFGLVDLADRPKWDLVERVRETNLQVARWRMDAARQNAGGR